MKVDKINIEIQFYSSSIVRVLKWPDSVNLSKESLSVIAKPSYTKDFKIRKELNNVLIIGKDLKISISLEDGNIAFYTVNDKLLLKEKEKSSLFFDFNDLGRKTYSISQAFLLDKNEAIYGLGQHQMGKMIQRNIKLKMIQGNTDDYIPFFVSNKGYGLFWDNYSPTIFNDSYEGTSFSSEVGDCIDYYFMYGSNADGVIAHMRTLTGNVPMFPLWTFGYWQSKERYKSQDEIVGVVRKYQN